MYQNIYITRKITIVSHETTICPFQSTVNGSVHAYKASFFFWKGLELNASLPKRQTKCSEQQKNINTDFC